MKSPKPIIGKRVSGEPPHEREHYIQCPDCGRWIDKLGFAGDIIACRRSSPVGAHRLLGGLLRRAPLDEELPPHADRDRARLHAVPALQLDLGTISPIGKACWRCRASCATALGRHDGDAISKTRRPTVVHPTFILSISFFHARPSTCRSFTNFRAARQRACAIPHRWRRAAVALSWSFVACPYLHGPGLSKTNES